MKKLFIVLGIILAIILVFGICLYFFVLQYPNLKENPKTDKWYRVETDAMKDSEGGEYHALFRKGSANKVMIYFAGGGASFNEQTAREDGYNTKMVRPDALANLTMNMGGLASDVEGSPFTDWTLILFPYATGDFHSGTGEFSYTDVDGKEKILYHNGYTNYTEAMKIIMDKAGIENADTVLVTGYSAGGFATALLADDIFTNYFPDTESKNVLVDAAVLLYDDWKYVAENVWEVPKTISDKLTSDNLTMDCLVSLREKYGDSINLMFDCSTRDGDLAKVQNYLDNGIMDVDEPEADVFQTMLRNMIPQFESINVHLFIFDGVAWYDDPRNMTAHTMIATPAVWFPFEHIEGQSLSGWLVEVMSGNGRSYGVELLNKIYTSTN